MDFNNDDMPKDTSLTLFFRKISNVYILNIHII